MCYLLMLNYLFLYKNINNIINMSGDTHWGWSTTIDLYNCDLELITNPQIIQEYVDELVELLEMKKYGKCHIVNFGKDPKVSGYSMFQMI